MKGYKRKQEPFYVKRSRLKYSVLKTNEILQSISVADYQRIKHKAKSQKCRSQEKSRERIKAVSHEKESIEYSELYQGKVSLMDYERMTKLLKACKTKRKFEKTDQVNKIGIDAKRLNIEPGHKRISASKHKGNFGVISKSLNNMRKEYFRSVEERVEEPAFLLTSNDGFQEFICCKSAFYQRRSPIKSQKDKRNKDQSPQFQLTTRSSARRNKAYLYQRVCSEKQSRDEQNFIYQKRINSYTQFLWKCMLSHNVYLNLDLPAPQLSVKKLKAYVGQGNNSNMIKGLLKRRFWWVLSEQLTDDCMFVWTQLKINKIFDRQESARLNLPEYKQQDNFIQMRKRLSRTCYSSKNKTLIVKNTDKTKFKEEISKKDWNFKIWTKKDQQILQKIVSEWTTLDLASTSDQFARIKKTSYHLKTQRISHHYKHIQCIAQTKNIQVDKPLQKEEAFYNVRPIVHNHLQNNFHLGNKKALFYNLREYCHRQSKDLFEYVPITFHIRNGFIDQEYKRFIKYYEKRKQTIQRGGEEENNNKTARNIWIVKPGENSNQGRGITVIDEIYQLNNIIKQSEQSSKSCFKKENQQKAQTFIVQLYIDRPFLYYGRKFDIRHYVLITNLYGIIRVYWYEEGYIRTSSYPFNIHDFQPEIHLTNDAIQKQYPEYGRYEPYNKISYSDFQGYLNTLQERKYDFKAQILANMKMMAKETIFSVITKLAPKKQMNNFQIFGLDFMIDRNFKPWLIEINTNPCLDCSCPLLDRIIPYMVEQSLKLSLDLVYPPPCHYPNTAKHYAPLINLQTFKFQLIVDSSTKIESAFLKQQSSLLQKIGEIEDDEFFKDEGHEMRLQDFT